MTDAAWADSPPPTDPDVLVWFVLLVVMAWFLPPLCESWFGGGQ